MMGTVCTSPNKNEWCRRRVGKFQTYRKNKRGVEGGVRTIEPIAG